MKIMGIYRIQIFGISYYYIKIIKIILERSGVLSAIIEKLYANY